MDKKMIKKMMEYGVSAEVVLKLMLDEESADAAPPDGTPDKEGIPQPEAPRKDAQQEDPVLKAIEHLTGMIAGQNIRRDYKDSHAETADDILAKVLINKGEEK